MICVYQRLSAAEPWRTGSGEKIRARKAGRIRRYGPALFAAMSAPGFAFGQSSWLDSIRRQHDEAVPAAITAPASLLGPALKEFVMWAGLLIGMAGVVWTIVDTYNRRRRTIPYLVVFVAAVIASNLERLLPPGVYAGPSSSRLVEILMLLGAAAAIGVGLFYLRGQPQESQPPGDEERRCPQCARPLEASSPSCPSCSWHPEAQTAPENFTMPVGATVQTDNGHQTVVIGKKSYPVYATLVVKEGDQPGEQFPVFDSRTVIGHDQRCQIVLSDDAVSREHAAITYQEGKFVLTDLNSSNGTFVNPESPEDAPLSGPHVLRDGDVISLGRAKLVYKRVW